MRNKHFVAICACLSVILILAGMIPFASANSGISQARYGVLRILCDGYQGISTGSGFIIAKDEQINYIATNYHVIEDNPNAVYIIPDNIRGTWLPAEVVYHQPGLDIVILSVIEGLDDRPVLPLVSTATVNFADTVYAIGFPGAAEEVIDDSNLLLSTADDVTITDGTVSNPSRKVDDGVFAIHSTAALTYGNSGGPLLNDKAEVIGINTWIYSEGAYGISYSMHIDYIIDICKQLGIPYVSPDSDDNTEPALDTPAPIITPEPDTVTAGNSASDVHASSDTGEFLYNNIGFIVVFGSLILSGTLTLVIVITQKGNFAAWLSQHKAAVAIVSTGFVIAIVIGIVLPIIFTSKSHGGDTVISDSLPSAQDGTQNNISVIKDNLIGDWSYTGGDWIWVFGYSTQVSFTLNNIYLSRSESTVSWEHSDTETDIITVWDSDYDQNREFRYSISGDVLMIIDEDEDRAYYKRVIIP